ncbi:MAG: pteridine reductase [Gammaproteobacteria bacterium]|nr:pteridine reductase [Gammaproteobacteria bacterium]
MSVNRQSLEGKWVLITGAARRVGASIARSLHDAGASVALHYRDSAGPAAELAAEFNAKRRDSALPVAADLLDHTALPRLVDAVVGRTGRLDVLINNASSFYPTPLGAVTPAQWDDLVGTNLKAPLFLSQAALPHLRASRGVIVNLIDIHAVRPLRNHPVYGAAKAGLAMLTRSLARDLAPDIRVNGIAPGAVLWPDDGIEERTRDSIIRQIPLQRAGSPEDIAGCVLFLVRDAPYVTGQIVTVDGGRSIGW